MDFLQNVQSVSIGERDIQKSDIVVVMPDGTKRLRGGTGFTHKDIRPAFFEDLAHAAAKQGVVICDEHVDQELPPFVEGGMGM